MREGERESIHMGGQGSRRRGRETNSPVSIEPYTGLISVTHEIMT